MEETFRLRGSETPIELIDSGITVVAPGLSGQGTYLGRRLAGEVRLVTDEPDDFRASLEEAELEDRHTLILEDETPTEPRPGPTLLGEIRPNEILLQVPSQEDEGQFLFYQDEDRVISIHLPTKVESGQALAPRGVTSPQLYQYRFKLRVPTGGAAARPGMRGLIGTVLRKVLKVVVFKLVERRVGKVLYGGVKRWEDRRRSFQGFHGGTYAELLADRPVPFERWAELAGKRSLLFLHGTTSTTSGAFAGLAHFQLFADRLYRAYENRVLGFNHHTLTVGVASNLTQFYKRLAQQPARYEFDVICHSRGGLLARALGELSPPQVAELTGVAWTKPSNIEVQINRVIFVGTPNAGTVLATPDKVPELVDRLANIVSSLPDSISTISLGAILSIAAYLAETAFKYLPGLADQAPGSKFLSLLNQPPADPKRYFAVQADYEPTGSLLLALKERLADRLADRLFSDKKNDLIVPTVGVSVNEEFTLDPSRVTDYDNTQGIHHTNYFHRKRTWQQIVNYLGV